jgi:ubiquinone biosynthesis monooxygenase Coq7
MGKSAVMACTAAVEDVVLRHLRLQLGLLEQEGDQECRDAVASIIADENEHLESGKASASNSLLHAPLHTIVCLSTETVIWLGMRL